METTVKETQTPDQGVMDSIEEVLISLDHLNDQIATIRRILTVAALIGGLWLAGKIVIWVLNQVYPFF